MGVLLRPGRTRACEALGVTTSSVSAGAGPRPPDDPGHRAGHDRAAARPRPPLVRRPADRWVAGVSGGVADHLGLPAPLVRFGLVLLVLVSGSGLVLYVWLWALVPVGPAPSLDPAPASGPAPDVAPADAPAAAWPGGGGQPRPHLSGGRPRGGAGGPQDAFDAYATRGADAPPPPGADALPTSSRRGDVLLAAVLLGAGVLLLGAVVAPGTAGPLVPLALVALGVLVAYWQLDEVERTRWARRAGGSGRAAAVRLAVGVLLVAVGAVLALRQGAGLSDLLRTLAATLAVLAGVALVLAPWGLRLWRGLDAERAARVREEERADIAAHLHDSVLQTLTLIQRSATQPGEVARLARAQERDLRGWLYAEPVADEGSLVAQLGRAAAEVEDAHGVVVDVVTVGDRPGDAATVALVAAAREALLNAARHAGAPVSLYAECGPSATEVFVRDRGVGFDPAQVPADRLGLRESVVGRVARAGGEARVRSAPGEGTEVRLRLPTAGRPSGERPSEDDGAQDRDDRPAGVPR